MLKRERRSLELSELVPQIRLLIRVKWNSNSNKAAHISGTVPRIRS